MRNQKSLNPRDKRAETFPLFRYCGMGALALFVSACAGRVYKESQNVALTGNPSKIEHCKNTGLVEITGSEENRDDRWLTFHEQAVVNGGNTVYLSSPGTSVTGSSYLCTPPIRSDDAQ